jgi:osmotically-inducible protein OsmY
MQKTTRQPRFDLGQLVATPGAPAALNIKIIAQDGKVTLRGPVRSEEEKANIEAKAVAAGGQDNVSNELQVAPPKN